MLLRGMGKPRNDSNGVGTAEALDGTRKRKRITGERSWWQSCFRLSGVKQDAVIGEKDDNRILRTSLPFEQPHRLSRTLCGDVSFLSEIMFIVSYRSPPRTQDDSATASASHTAYFMTEEDSAYWSSPATAEKGEHITCHFPTYGN